MNPIAAFADTMPMGWATLAPRRPTRESPFGVAALSRAVSRWIDWSRSRHQLDELDDHMLKDIGLTRGEAAREATKFFWQA